MKVFGTDYDGVIINIEPQKAGTFGTLLEQEWGINKKQAEKFWIEKGGTSRKYKFDYFYEKKFGKKLKDPEYKKIEEKFSKVLRIEFYPKLKLLPGALELLGFAQSSFDYLFVSSGIPTEELQYLINLNNLSSYFDLIMGTGDKYNSKKDHFKHLINEQKPELIVYVSDGLEDMKIAKEFNAFSIGIPVNHSKKELINAGANKVCGLSDVVALIKNEL